MVFITGGSFEMGADNNQAQQDEYPKHKVTVNSFWMDKTEVTNAEFALFVKQTNYITTAEKKIDWNELKKQFSILGKLCTPKAILAIPHFVRTENGKINRKESLKQMVMRIAI